MRRFIFGLFATLGAFTFLLILGLSWSFYQLSSPSLSFASSSPNQVISLTLGEQSLDEQPKNKGLISLIKGQSVSLHTIVSGINHAAQNSNVQGIFLKIEGNALRIATIQELRDALKAFKTTGKFVYTYTDSFGELSNATGAYYLAAASSKIWVMPIGSFNFNGLIAEIPFAKKILEDYKIIPQMGRREEYKGMVESYTESDFTPPYRQNMQRLLDSITTQIINDVAADRNLKAEEVRKLLNTAPHTLPNALAAKMIDEIGYKDQVKNEIEKQVGSKPTYVEFEVYSNTIKQPSQGDQIAIIYAEGTISKNKMAHNPLSDDSVMDAVEIAKTIREAGKNKNIKAVILRIDSGGGFPIACELIAREVELLKSVKPVIVSMSNYAASGGYWIACNARKIVAQPATTTGSIGVYAGKIVTQAFWDHYGIHWGKIHTGDNAAIWSTGKEFSVEGRQKFNGYLDQIYAVFQEKVAKGRNLSVEKVHQIAKGQVWTGIEAKENGLVDELGGVMKAIEIAKKEAGIAPQGPVHLRHLPESKSLFETVFERNQSSEATLLAQFPALRSFLQYVNGLLLPGRVELKVDPLTPQ
ncbi:MAG: signal peptide peptidase SppA [Alphaproteobacteria bacterium]|nr:signal peptide peptidase SppA [Alphaproteobacteria bacterium]